MDYSEKLLLVTPRIASSPKGGREQLSALHYKCLREIFRGGLEVFELEPAETKGTRSPIAAWRGHIDGLTAARLDQVLAVIKARKISRVFLDGSNLGSLASAIKIRLTGVSVTTFLHNVESSFFLGALLKRFSSRALGVLGANFLAERRAVIHSDQLICLSSRDSALLRRVYGRSATHISAMAVSDKFRPGSSVSGGGYALFVGGAFYANVAGIRWFVNQVAPHICTRVIIVGNGFGALRTELERTGKVQVVGAVDDLSDWYGGAEFVIAPIFDGSGMKTKVAEALMFGKKVVGTPEAFSGYEAVADQAGWTCTTATDFIDVIERLQLEPPMAFDPALRSIYEANFSSAAALKRLQQILCESNSDTVSA